MLFKFILHQIIYSLYNSVLVLKIFCHKGDHLVYIQDHRNIYWQIQVVFTIIV
jgi:hypothetical protein